MNDKKNEIPVVDATEAKTGLSLMITGREGDVTALVEKIKGTEGVQIIGESEQKPHPAAPEGENIVVQGMLVAPLTGDDEDDDDDDD